MGASDLAYINSLLMATTPHIKRLFMDLETSPCIGYFWRPGYKVNLSYDNILEENKIICICYKWQHEDKVHSLTWDSKQNDKKMLQKFIKVANKADELVGHNGDRFDLKWVKTRCLKHNIPAFPKYATLDTLKAARGTFLFNSNRLDYIGQFLGVGQKTETGGFQLWKDVMTGDKKALAKMVEYCENDVVLLQDVWERMKNYVPHKTSIRGQEQDLPKYCCPECGNKNVYLNKTRSTAMGTIQRDMHCKTGCGKYFRISNKSYMDLLLDRAKNKI